MKCYAIHQGNEGFYIAAHSLVNAIQCYCDYIRMGIHELPQFGVNVARISKSAAKQIQIHDDLVVERLNDLVEQRELPGVIASFVPSNIRVNLN